MRPMILIDLNAMSSGILLKVDWFTVKQRFFARANAFRPIAVTDVTLSALPTTAVGQKGWFNI